MKKSLILFPLMAALLCSCGGNGSSTGSTTGTDPQPVGGAVVYDFSSLTGTGDDELGENAAELIKGCKTSGTDIISTVTATKVYNGAGSGGCHKGEAKLIKFGTSSVNGSLDIKLSKKVTKVTFSMHDFYKTTEGYTVNDYVVVNGTEKICPQNATGAAEDVSFTVTETDSIKIESKNTDSSKGGRFYVFKLTLE